MHAAAEGYVPTGQRGGSEDGTGPTIALPAAAGLGGRVIDAGGKVLAGVEVEVSPSDASGPRGMRMASPEVTLPRARTSRDGRFRLPGLPAEMGYRLAFSKAGYLPAIPEEKDTWLYFSGYVGAGIILGLAAYEGWRMVR